MTLESNSIVRSNPAPSDGEESFRIVTGKVVSLRTILAALVRKRPLLVALGAIGLLVGTGYHVLVPVKYYATATLYLAHPVGSDGTVVAQNDLAILDTAAVAEKAIAALGTTGKGLTPKSLLGKAPATIQSGNVMALTIAGPSPAAALRRVDALARAYLTFRNGLYDAQNRSLVSATEQQIARLQAEVTHLNMQIANFGSSEPAVTLANLQQQRAAATTEISSLQQSIQQGDLNTLSVVNGSRIITPGTAVPTSKKKAFIEDGLGGLVAGLALGVIGVAVAEVLSDRVRRREELAVLLAAPVAVSVGPLSRRARFQRRCEALLPGRRRHVPYSSELPVRITAQYLKDQLAARGPKSTEVIVACDDITLPASALFALARTLRESGERVIFVDDTYDRSVGRALGSRAPGMLSVQLAEGLELTLLVPNKPWEEDRPGDSLDGLGTIGELASADAVLVLATVDPALGAWHLRRWASEAVVTVSAGESTMHHVGAIAELLSAAGVTITSAVLLGSERTDDTPGLPVAGTASLGRGLRVLTSVPGSGP